MTWLLLVLAADFSGTWVGPGVHGGPMCLALSQSDSELSGNAAYENDRKYAAISNGKVDGQKLSFEIEDMDHGKMLFRFRVEGEKLIAEDGAVLTRWMPRRNRQFDAGRPVAPRIVHHKDLSFDEAARKWKFTPPREDCQFVTKRTTIEFHVAWL